MNAGFSPDCVRTRGSRPHAEARRCADAERGTSLLECAAALALAGLAVVSGLDATSTAADLLRRAHVAHDAATIARDVLDTEIGAPCGPTFPCPEEFRCTVARTRLATALDRVTSVAERRGGDERVELRTLAAPPPCRG